MTQPIGRLDIGNVGHPIVIDEHRRQFRVDAGESAPAWMDFRLRGTVLSVLHTEVTPALRGKGVAEPFVRVVLEYARSRQWTVKPYCPYVAEFMRRQREFDDLLDPSFTLPAVASS